MANVYTHPENNLSSTISGLRAHPETSDDVLRGVRGYSALIALDSDWPSPLGAYREACRAVKERAIELSAGDQLSAVQLTDALIDAALKAVKKKQRKF